VHVQYAYDDRSVVVVNNTGEPLRGLRVNTTVRHLTMKRYAQFEDTVDVPPDGVRVVRTLPEFKNISPTYFVKLALADSGGHALSDNLYWLSTKEDDFDFPRSTWYYTPLSAYADLTALQGLSPATLDVSAQVERRGAEETVRVRLANPRAPIAFFVRLHLTRGRDGEDLVPVLWQDNYLSLLPEERREITATYRVRDLGGASPALTVSGWNVAPRAVAISGAR
jgi:exo-1,4-beta-D-glucosaminidase